VFSAGSALPAMALADLSVKGLYMHSDIERHGSVSVGAETAFLCHSILKNRIFTKTG
jgi:hypothetical protein